MHANDNEESALVAPILALDPGSDKCGLAVVAPGSGVLQRRIVAPDEIEIALRELLPQYGVTRVILGNATTSRAMRERVSTLFPEVELVEVDERNSTLEARELYWKENPPRGWRRVLPLSLQVPPEPVDDFAAVVLALRFLHLSKDD